MRGGDAALRQITLTTFYYYNSISNSINNKNNGDDEDDDDDDDPRNDYDGDSEMNVLARHTALKR